MLDFLIKPENLIAIATAIAVVATILTVIMPMLQPDKLGNRMKSVALEREQMRARERAKQQTQKGERGTAKQREASGFIKTLVEGLNLKKALADGSTEEMLVRAGFRGQRPLFVLLGLRFGLPIMLILVSLIYIFLIKGGESDLLTNMIICFFAAAAGFYLPVMVVKKMQKARALSITQAWPDALDLCLICVESGMSIEVAFRKVAAEIGPQSVALADELMITTAELSFLTERRTAYDNLVHRTGLESVKNVVMSLIQAEKYGTPLSTALRVLSRENRDIRLAAAEKKAASLPPKLTVPMMVCFLPVLFCVILAPAIIRTMAVFS